VAHQQALAAAVQDQIGRLDGADVDRAGVGRRARPGSGDHHDLAAIQRAGLLVDLDDEGLIAARAGDERPGEHAARPATRRTRPAAGAFQAAGVGLTSTVGVWPLPAAGEPRYLSGSSRTLAKCLSARAQ